MECVCDCVVRTYVQNMVELLVRGTGFGLYYIVIYIVQSNVLSEYLEGYTIQICTSLRGTYVCTCSVVLVDIVYCS